MREILLERGIEYIQKIIPNIDEKLVETLLSFLYLDKSTFTKFPIVLLKNIILNPKYEFKVLDALLFLLQSPHLSTVITNH